MISSCLNRRGFYYASLLTILSFTNKKTSQLELPESEFQVGDHIRTERICENRISPNYGGLDWECGFVLGYIWQWNGWRLERFFRGWIYWVLFDKSNSEIDSDRQWLDFIHHTEVIGE